MVATKMINFLLYLRLLKKLFQWPKSHFEGALDRFLVKPSEGTGGARRDRTADLLHAMQALSHLSYSPIFMILI